MQWDNLTLVRKWHEYVGPKDERLEAEKAKVYKTGFMRCQPERLCFSSTS